MQSRVHPYSLAPKVIELQSRDQAKLVHILFSGGSRKSLRCRSRLISYEKQRFNHPSQLVYLLKARTEFLFCGLEDAESDSTEALEAFHFDVITLLEARFSGDEFRAQIGVQQYISVNKDVTLSAFGTFAASRSVHYFLYLPHGARPYEPPLAACFLPLCPP